MNTHKLTLILFTLVCIEAKSLLWGVLVDHPVVDSQDPESTTKDPDLSSRHQSKATRHQHGQQDRCFEDLQCGKGRFCDLHYGVCRNERTPGFACRRDRMCARGLHCMFGRCQAKIPRGEEGARCSDDGECHEGLCCARRHGEGVCQRRLSLGQRCYVPDGGLEYSLNQMCPCQRGLVCTQTSNQTTNSTSTDGVQVSWSSTDDMRCQIFKL